MKLKDKLVFKWKHSKDLIANYEIKHGTPPPSCSRTVEMGFLPESIRALLYHSDVPTYAEILLGELPIREAPSGSDDSIKRFFFCITGYLITAVEKTVDYFNGKVPSIMEPVIMKGVEALVEPNGTIDLTGLPSWIMDVATYRDFWRSVTTLSRKRQQSDYEKRQLASREASRISGKNRVAQDKLCRSVWEKTIAEFAKYNGSDDLKLAVRLGLPCGSLFKSEYIHKHYRMYSYKPANDTSMSRFKGETLGSVMRAFAKELLKYPQALIYKENTVLNPDYYAAFVINPTKETSPGMDKYDILIYKGI